MSLQVTAGVPVISEGSLTARAPKWLVQVTHALPRVSPLLFGRLWKALGYPTQQFS